jgi:hypothetical protein
MAPRRNDKQRVPASVMNILLEAHASASASIEVFQGGGGGGGGGGGDVECKVVVVDAERKRIEARVGGEWLVAISPAGVSALNTKEDVVNVVAVEYSTVWAKKVGGGRAAALVVVTTEAFAVEFVTSE